MQENKIAILPYLNLSNPNSNPSSNPNDPNPNSNFFNYSGWFESNIYMRKLKVLALVIITT